MKRLLLFVLIIMGFCGRFASDAKRCPVAQVRGEKRNVSICGRPEND